MQGTAVVDLVSVQRRLVLLQDYAELLTVLRDLAPEEYLARRFEGRYLVQVCAQIAIDLANHLIASEGWPAARDQRDAVTRLVEHQVLPGDLGGRMQALVGLRNRLVHLYADIDDQLVHDALAAGLRDLDEYAAAIAAFASST